MLRERQTVNHFGLSPHEVHCQPYLGMGAAVDRGASAHAFPVGTRSVARSQVDMILLPALRLATRPFPPGFFAARFLAAVILPPLLFFAILNTSSCLSLHTPTVDSQARWGNGTGAEPTRYSRPETPMRRYRFGGASSENAAHGCVGSLRDGQFEG
jgi:hypothetical protein